MRRERTRRKEGADEEDGGSSGSVGSCGLSVHGHNDRSTFGQSINCTLIAF